METATSWKTQEMEILNTAPANGEDSPEALQNGNSRLRALALQLLDEVQSIEEGVPVDEVKPHNLDGGLDFYDEVRRFEIDLIKRALRQTAGHQSRAAKLLTLKVSTLNAKIKHYNLEVMEFAKGHSLNRPADAPVRQFA